MITFVFELLIVAQIDAIVVAELQIDAEFDPIVGYPVRLCID